MFDAILPTLSLDLTDLLDDSGDNFSDFFFNSLLCLLYLAGLFCSTFSPETVQHLSNCG